MGYLVSALSPTAQHVYPPEKICTGTDTIVSSTATSEYLLLKMSESCDFVHIRYHNV